MITSFGQIWRRSSSGVWAQLPGAAREIAIGSDGSVWVIGTNPVGGGYGILQYQSTGDWKQISGGGVRIGVSAAGYPWVVNDQGAVWQYDNISGGWLQMMPNSSASAVTLGGPPPR